MENFNKDMLKRLANQVMFDLSDEECEEFQSEFEIYLKQIDLLNKVNTDGVEEMVYPFETPTAFLRNDGETYAISQQDAMKNVPHAGENYVIVPKVVK